MTDQENKDAVGAHAYGNKPVDPPVDPPKDPPADPLPPRRDARRVDLISYAIPHLHAGHEFPAFRSLRRCLAAEVEGDQLRILAEMGPDDRQTTLRLFHIDEEVPEEWEFFCVAGQEGLSGEAALREVVILYARREG